MVSCAMRIKPGPLLIGALSLAMCLAVTLGWESRQRGAYSGDGYTNNNVMHGGRNFAHFGLLAMKMVPVQAPVPPDATAISQIPRRLFYTHYPPGPDIVQFLLFKLGLESQRSHQLAQYAVTIAGIVFCWLALGTFFTGWPRIYAYMAALLSCSFIFFADSLQSFSWFFFFIWLYLYLVFNRPHVGMFFAIGLFSSWFSLDTVVPLQCLSLIPLGLKKLPLRRRLLLAAAMPCGEATGFALHLLHNALFLGGLSEAFQDIFKSYRQRAGAMSPEELNDPSLNYSLARHGVKYIIGLQWFYTLPLVAAAAAGWALAKRRPLPVLMPYLAMACIAGALLWQMAMKQHSMIHGFTIRHADVFVVLGLGFFTEWALKAKKPALRAMPPILALALLTHTTLSLAGVEGVAFKHWAVRVLVKDEHRAAWACLQEYRLRYSSELEGGKQVIRQYLPGEAGVKNCQRAPTAVPSTAANNLAALVLFLR